MSARMFTIVLIAITLLQLCLPSSSLPVTNRIKILEDDPVESQVKAYTQVSKQIIDFITKGKGKHQTYNRLAAMTDKFGNRQVGSETLENVIDYMLSELKADGLENVHGETVTDIPHWVRGQESARLLEPRNYEMSILGLGSSVGTSPEGITAEVIVVHSFDELHSRALEVSRSC